MWRSVRTLIDATLPKEASMLRPMPFVLLAAAGLTIAVIAHASGADPAAAAAAAADAALGDAPAESFTWEKFWHMIKAGGVTMVPLGLLSVGALAYSIERFLRMRRDRLIPAGLADRCRALWSAGDYDAVIAEAKKTNSSLGKAIAIMATYRDRPMESVMQSALDVAIAEVMPHLRACKPLIIIATTAPLLGLFGTILGMMGAFAKFQTAANKIADPGLFAANISEALVTAATGLIIAAYSLFLYHIFKNRAQRLGDMVEAEVNTLGMEWLLGKTASKP